MTNSDNTANSKKVGFFARLKQRLNLGGGLRLGSLNWLVGRKLDAELEEQIEERLLIADVGVDTTRRILENLRRRLASPSASLTESDGLREALRDELLDILKPAARPLQIDGSQKPFLILMVGVNGAGKTTTIGKLAKRFKDQGLSVLLAAGDTYRAAATEQLQAWGTRNSLPVVTQPGGSDPAAVIFDALNAAKARGIDIVLADTAGRLQNQDNLMRELQKVVRVAKRVDENAPHEIMLVLDASLGQNALNQAQQFNKAIGLTGITMTKLDGGGRGGILIAIADRMQVPFRFIGMGEQQDDMVVFDADKFVDALLDAPETARQDDI